MYKDFIFSEILFLKQKSDFTNDFIQKIFVKQLIC